MEKRANTELQKARREEVGRARGRNVPVGVSCLVGWGRASAHISLIIWDWNSRNLRVRVQGHSGRTECRPGALCSSDLGVGGSARNGAYAVTRWISGAATGPLSMSEGRLRSLE